MKYLFYVAIYSAQTSIMIIEVANRYGVEGGTTGLSHSAILAMQTFMSALLPICINGTYPLPRETLKYSPILLKGNNICYSQNMITLS